MDENRTEALISDDWRRYATICRLCLQKDGFMLGIFNNIQEKEQSILRKIIDCTALSVHQGDGLPNVICHRCLFKIEFCLEFRQLCFISDATLRQLHGMSQENGGELISNPDMPLYEQVLSLGDENVVMVVDPKAMDYESDSKSDDLQSDTELNEPECKNVFMCKFCDHAFTDKAEHAEHEISGHHSSCPYNCMSCDISFSDRLVYSAHMKNAHKNDKPYNCPQCDRTFARRSDLRKHTIVHTGVKPYTCTVCSKSFSRNTNLSKHMRIHSGTKPFVCPKCPRTFTSKGDLNRHSIIHSGQRPFRCSYCPMSFGRKDKLLRHEKRHWAQQENNGETENFPIISDNLDVSEHNNSSIHGEDQELLQGGKPEHNTTEETQVYPDNGLSTGESFSYEDSPLSKSPTDMDKRTYKCKMCPKCFSTSDNLKYHMARHTGIKPFSCHVCSKSFIRKRELDRHIVTHTGLRPFKCPKCMKSFGRKDKLVRHVRIHDRT